MKLGQIRVEGCDEQPDFVQISWDCPIHGEHVYAGKWSRLDELVEIVCGDNPGVEAVDLHDMFTQAALAHERQRVAAKRILS